MKSGNLLAIKQIYIQVTYTKLIDLVFSALKVLLLSNLPNSRSFGSELNAEIYGVSKLIKRLIILVKGYATGGGGGGDYIR